MPVPSSGRGPRRRTLARCPACRVRVAVDVYVDHRAEAGVGDRAVVALEVVPRSRPSSWPLAPFPPSVELERVDVDAGFGDDRRSSPSTSARAGASRSAFANTNGPTNRPFGGTRAPPRENPARGRREVRYGDIRRGRTSRRGYGHWSVRRLPSPDTTSWPRWRHTLTCPRRTPSPLAHDRGRNVADAEEAKQARLRDLLGPADIYCHVRAKMRVLEVHDRRIRVPVGGKCVAAGEVDRQGRRCQLGCTGSSYAAVVPASVPQ